MKIIKFKEWDCHVFLSTYTVNNQPAIILRDATDGQQIAVASVCLIEIPNNMNTTIIKDYSENEGMVSALTEAGIILPLRDVGPDMHLSRIVPVVMPDERMPAYDKLYPTRLRTEMNHNLRELKFDGSFWTNENNTIAHTPDFWIDTDIVGVV